MTDLGRPRRRPRAPRGRAIDVPGARQVLWRRLGKSIRRTPLLALPASLDVWAAVADRPLIGTSLGAVLALLNLGSAVVLGDVTLAVIRDRRLRRALAESRWRTYYIVSTRPGKNSFGLALQGVDGIIYFVELASGRREKERPLLGGRTVWLAGDLSKHAILTPVGGGELYWTNLADAWYISAAVRDAAAEHTNPTAKTQRPQGKLHGENGVANEGLHP